MSKSGSRSRVRALPGGDEGGVIKRLNKTLEMVLPETEYPSGTNDTDRKRRLKAVKDFTDAQADAKKVFRRIEEGLDEEKAAREERLGTLDHNQEAHRRSDENARARAERRKDFRQVIEGIERLSANQDRSRAKNAMIVLLIITVLASIALAFIGVLRHEPVWLGGFGLGSLLSGGEIYVFRLVHQGADLNEQAMPRERTEGSEPFQWSEARPLGAEE